MSGGPVRFLSALAGLASAFAPLREAVAASAIGDGGNDAIDAVDTVSAPDARDIVVFGRHDDGSFDGVSAEDELDRNGIDAYGADTIGELISQLTSDLTSGEDGPVILINGQRASGINDISDLPVEAASKVQLLPRAVAARLGQSPSQRVINVIIKPNHAQVTPRGRAALATHGGGFQGDAELNLLKLQNGNRRSLVLLATTTDRLLESQRSILPDQGAVPYDPLGNVVASAGAGREIDPALTALAGRLVTVAANPRGIVRPSLADFVRTAGQPNATFDGRYRSLIPQSHLFSANAGFSQRLSNKTTLLLNAKAEFGQSEALRGLTPALVQVPAGTPDSPFSSPVSLAYVVGGALRSRQDYFAINLAQILNSSIGKFNLSLQTTFNHRIQTVLSDRPIDLTALQAGVSAGTINPFSQVSQQSFAASAADRSRNRSDGGMIQFSAGGPLLNLPAGPVLLATALQARFDRSESVTSGSFAATRRFRRDELGARANLTVPFIGGTNAPLRMTADFGGALHKHTSSGTLHDLSASYSIDYGKHLSFSASYVEEQIAPPASALNDSPVTTENFRTFDFVRGETVLVRSISGGNPLLPTQRKRTGSIQVTLRPLASNDLQVSGEYSRVVNRDLYSALPPVSADVQLAFPDRFVRDGSGRLTQIDARPVAFLRDEGEKLRWGIRLRRSFGGLVTGGDEGERAAQRPARPASSIATASSVRLPIPSFS